MRNWAFILAVLILAAFGGWNGMILWDGLWTYTVTFGQYMIVTVIVVVLEIILLAIAFPVQRK